MRLVRLQRMEAGNGPAILELERSSSVTEVFVGSQVTPDQEQGWASPSFQEEREESGSFMESLNL